MTLDRIIIHWTAGAYDVSAEDRKHYHFIIDGAGNVHKGDKRPEDNLSTQDGVYAAHTLKANTGAIGIAVAAMAGAQERPFSAGKYPIKQVQIDALVGQCARLCKQYGIPVTKTNVLTHAEVQPTLKIQQRGKWDITWLPGMKEPGDPIAVGNKLRALIFAETPKEPEHKPAPAINPPKDHVPVAAPSESWLVALMRAILALFKGKR